MDDDARVRLLVLVWVANPVDVLMSRERLNLPSGVMLIHIVSPDPVALTINLEFAASYCRKP